VRTWRHVLITIDPADAATMTTRSTPSRDEDPKNPGGWIVWVAIADVAAYVRPNSALDETAREKATAVYSPTAWSRCCRRCFSNGLCSSGKAEPRLHGRAHGLRRWRQEALPQVIRGLMRSAAKLSTSRPGLRRGMSDDKTGPIAKSIIAPLYAAYAVLKKGRLARSPCHRERRAAVVISAEGEVASITPRASLEAHKLIEEMMIQANVSAAETLEAKRTPLIYRIHDTPSQEEGPALVDFLADAGHRLVEGERRARTASTSSWTRRREGPNADIVNEVVLRNPDAGDLFDGEHRPLRAEPCEVRPLHLADPPLRRPGRPSWTDRGAGARRGRPVGPRHPEMKDTAESITFAERRAMAAERDATDRYVAAYLSEPGGARSSTGGLPGSPALACSCG